jgi:TolB-like protein
LFEEAELKTAAIVISICLTMLILSCAATPEKPTDYMGSAPAATAAKEKRTPRFAQMTEAVDYLGVALNEEIYRLKMSDGFSASATGGTGPDRATTPEDDTRSRAEDVMDELDREIAAQDGGSSQTVTSSEQYTSTETSNMAGAGPGADEPMVIAVADFLNDDGKISKLGRYTAEKLTPYFTRSDQFQVLERALIDKVIAEQQFQVSAFVDESATQEIGKLLGAETIVSGTISELNDAFYFNAKVVDVAHGKLLTSIDVEVDRTGRLVALYSTALPKPPKEKPKLRIFRARGIGVPSKKHTNPTLARTMAARAAQADAMRNLVVEIEGAKVSAETTVKDYMTENDAIDIHVNSYLRGARVINKTEMQDGAVEVEMEVEVPGEFFESLQKN